MDSYQQSKKARYVASCVYLLVLAFLVGGTLLSEHNKQEADKENGQTLATESVR
jgi:hypothetical protein